MPTHAEVIEGLVAENARLRAALAHYADEGNWHQPLTLSEGSEWWYYRWGGVRTSGVFKRPWDVARAALAGREREGA